MSCKEDILNDQRVIIGIRDYLQCANPESKLYLNDLPGMSLKSAAQIAPEQWQTGAEFLKQSTKMAVQMVFDEFAQELQPYFDFGNIIETREVKTYSTKLNAMSANYRGIVVKRWRSEAARLFVEEVYIKVNQGGETTLRIVDGSTTTDTTVTLVEGENTIRVDYKAESEQIKILFDQTNFETFDCAYRKQDGCSTCSGSAGKGIYITGWDGLKEVSNCYGVGTRVHAMCYEDNILCSLMPKMYFLLLYKSGILVLKERIATDRINHVATFGAEKAKMLLEDYEKEYKEKYSILVKSANNFLRTTKGECIKCNNLRYVQATP
jgi:hypothetical protein